MTLRRRRRRFFAQRQSFIELLTRRQEPGVRAVPQLIFLAYNKDIVLARFPRGVKWSACSFGECAELQSGLRAKSRGKDSKNAAWHSSHVSVSPRHASRNFSFWGRDFPRLPLSAFSPAFQLFSVFPPRDETQARRRKETVSTEPVMEEGFTRGRKRRQRLRSRWVRGLSEIPFRSCKVSYLRRFMRRLVSHFSLSSSIRFALSGCIILRSPPLHLH